MSTPSSTVTEKPARKGLRDSALGRIAILAVVLAVAGVAAKAWRGEPDTAVSQSEAVAKARAVAVFEPHGHQIRYLNQGIPPTGTWVVSFYRGTLQHPVVLQTVLVNATTGQITDDGR